MTPDSHRCKSFSSRLSVSSDYGRDKQLWHKPWGRTMQQESRFDVCFVIQNTPAARLIPLITSNITSKSAIIRRYAVH